MRGAAALDRSRPGQARGCWHPLAASSTVRIKLKSTPIVDGWIPAERRDCRVFHERYVLCRDDVCEIELRWINPIPKMVEQSPSRDGLNLLLLPWPSRSPTVCLSRSVIVFRLEGICGGHWVGGDLADAIVAPAVSDELGVLFVLAVKPAAHQPTNVSPVLRVTRQSCRNFVAAKR